MKYIYGAAALVLLLIGGFVYFIYHGYDYTLSAGTLSDTKREYALTQRCIRRQAEKSALQAPIQAEIKPLTDKLAYGALPAADGQETYDTYVTLRDQVNQLEIEYAC